MGKTNRRWPIKDKIIETPARRKPYVQVKRKFFLKNLMLSNLPLAEGEESALPKGKLKTKSAIVFSALSPGCLMAGIIST